MKANGAVTKTVIIRTSLEEFESVVVADEGETEVVEAVSAFVDGLLVVEIVSDMAR